jgi:hypothetical protein
MYNVIEMKDELNDAMLIARSRGECSTTRKRITSHLFNAKYKEEYAVRKERYESGLEGWQNWHSMKRLVIRPPVVTDDCIMPAGARGPKNGHLRARTGTVTKHVFCRG